MTPEEARASIENDVDVGSSIRYAISVLEEAATLAERERCAKVAVEVGGKAARLVLPRVLEGVEEWFGNEIAARIREGTP